MSTDGSLAWASVRSLDLGITVPRLFVTDAGVPHGSSPGEGSSACASVGNVPERWSGLRRRDRVDPIVDALGAGQAALPLPDRERSLERFTHLVDPSCALEHGGEVL